jgi:collagenase-like PrtC family protease
MKIIAGISHSQSDDEIRAYVDAGIDEFFIGYVPQEWSDTYGWEVSCNRREFSNCHYHSVNQIEQVVSLIHKYNKKVFLTLNAHEYNAEQIKLLLRIVDDIRHVNFDAFIVSNTALMLELRRNGFKTPINISIGAGCNNADAVLFYKKYISNIGRVVIPRRLTMEEIKNITDRLKGEGLSLEVFGLADGCFFNDEHCFTWHGASNKSFCDSPMYKHRIASPIVFGKNWKNELSPEHYGEYVEKHLRINNDIEARKNTYRQNRPVTGYSVSDVAYLDIITRINKCGLCALKKFREWGIDAVKLPLRGSSYQVNVKLVKLTRQVIDAPEATPEYCQKLIGVPSYCAGSNCFYNFPYEN